MKVRDILEALDDVLLDAEVQAVTPHGTYTFNVVAVEGDSANPVLRLVESIRQHRTTKHCWCNPTVEYIPPRPSRFGRITPDAR